MLNIKKIDQVLKEYKDSTVNKMLKLIAESSVNKSNNEKFITKMF